MIPSHAHIHTRYAVPRVTARIISGKVKDSILISHDLQELRGAYSNCTFEKMKAVFACGSMVLLFSFSRKVGSRSQLFGKKNGRFRPAGGEISFQVSDRITCVTYRSYVVRIQTARLKR